MRRHVWILLLAISLSACILDEGTPTQTAMPSTTKTVVVTETTCTITTTCEPASVSTVTPSSTLTSTLEIKPTATFTLMPTPVSFYLQEGSPAYITNFVYPKKACNWMGVAGQVFDTNNVSVINLVIIVKGQLGGRTIDEIAVTGIPEAYVYGPGGYEVQLADQALESSGTLFIQVFGLEGIPLSNPVPFDTHNDCNKNLIIINFVEK